MPARKLREFLDSHRVKYVSMTHSPAFTAQEVASMAHIRGEEFAKTVIVKIDGAMVMAVLPASFQVDMATFHALTHGHSCTLAPEREFRAHFPECETGAMPPFGQLYGMPVYVDESLTHDKEIAFNAGTHHEVVRMAYKDFAKLVEPKVAAFSTAGEELALRL